MQFCSRWLKVNILYPRVICLIMEFIVFYLGGMLILYFVIQVAVTKGINNSIIGKLLEKEYGERVNENFTVEDVLESYKNRDDTNKS